jgi:allophanate hydrolase
MMAVVDPVAAAAAAIAADHAYADPALWITRVPDDEIRAAAARLAAEGPRGRPLWGVPFAVKDHIDIAGLPTTAACPGFTYHPATSAPAVERLIEAGALLIGKTNLDQFATGLVGVRSPFGTPRNVFSADHVPGGSSSGSGVAVAAGIVWFALGTDTAGSGRVPAMFGNIVGLKPSVGGVSNRGMVPACRSIDVISVFARSVDDSLAVARVIGGYDTVDPYSRQAPSGWLDRGACPDGARVAHADVASLCDPQVAQVYAAVCEKFAGPVAEMAPFLEIARLLYEGPWVAERTDALRMVLETQPEILLPVTRKIVATGLERRTVDAFAAFHRLALARRAAANLFAEVDALLLPTAPFCPSLDELVADPIGPNARLGTFTNFVNLCDLAAIAVPAGFTASGMPVGVTVIGPAWSEGRLAAIADRIHRAATLHVGATQIALPAPAAVPALQSDESALFCIGAHMSGLKLNGQITALGGRFLRAASTVPGYRLFALGERPGLLRDTSGAAIAGEVWAVPRAAIGALLAQVPGPLGFGEVALDDGPCLGFLAEAAGVVGAVDITAFGGWRAYLASRSS